MTVLLEVCVDDADGLEAAVEGGADRVELCAALALGGLTPSRGMMALAASAPIPVYAMIRPRAGDFVFGPKDRDVMRRDIEAAGEAGLAGIVIGASRPDGTLDEDMLADLLGRAGRLGATLHRAVDLVPDLTAAVETAAQLGFERILTSGGARTAWDGRAGLARAIAASEGSLSIMAGSGLDPAIASALLSELPLGEIHASCSVASPASPASQVFGFGTATQRRTAVFQVRAMKNACVEARTER